MVMRSIFCHVSRVTFVDEVYEVVKFSSWNRWRRKICCTFL